MNNEYRRWEDSCDDDRCEECGETAVIFRNGNYYCADHAEDHSPDPDEAYEQSVDREMENEQT